MVENAAQSNESDMSASADSVHQGPFQQLKQLLGAWLSESKPLQLFLLCAGLAAAIVLLFASRNPRDDSKPITVGASVVVIGMGNQTLNIRSAPGLNDSRILFRAQSGTAFAIVGGPQQADGFTWWQVREAEFQLLGWAAGKYLKVDSTGTGREP